MIAAKPEKKQLTIELFAFLAITFATTYLLEFFVIMQEGSGILSSKWMLIPMYIPAVGAILCMVGFRSTALTRESKQFLAMFLLASAVTLVEGLYQPLLGTIGPFPLLTAIISVAAFLMVLILSMRASGRRSLADAKLSFGHNYRYYLIIPVIFSVLFILGYFMSSMLGLSFPTMEYNPGSFFVFIGMYLMTFIIAWPKYFGEEYGWRFYLQDRVFALFGVYPGVVLVGIVWGLWHLPLMLVGLNFPDNPLAGNIVYIGWTIILGIIYSYAVLKTRSIWIAVLLHALTDSFINTGNALIADANILVAFLPILLLMGICAAVLIRSRVWKDETAGGNIEKPSSV
ncbi:MAG: type II CAAX endopeptidase family protein [Methanocalculus sp.]|uniref:CPBP family intramembrane glutamic endopeptidase n=1 Tax=Methanocalculus sp. TaxID=2004547 RepID=UPI002728FBC5|nr:type II CAAX endopeptidase family protein [Methanocalculus sp.]MDO9538763.1 type II CAAX endopeptidase family protein [Methanocalculus sp.]